jgi:beta-glucosidase
MDERTWREFFLPPWRAMAVEAKVSGFMSSYMAVDLTGGQGAGVPDSASRLLLTDTIRSDWNWSGYILSDAGAVAFVGTTDWQGTDIGHGYSPNASAAAAAALDAGLDLELTCCDLPTVFPTLVESVLSGQVSEAAVDTALHRTLPIRFELGTLDPPGSSPYDNFTAANVSAPWMIDLALEAARQGLVLLKNADVPGSLPWSPRALAGKTIAVIGFTANQTQGQEGGYVNQNPPFIRTTLDGITDAFPLSIVGFTSGCSSYACPTLDVAGVASAAADADAVIVVLGTTVTNGVMPDSPCSPDNVAMEAEGWDRAGTQLPGMQLNLLQVGATITPHRHFRTHLHTQTYICAFSRSSYVLALQTAASAVRQGTPILLVLINAGMLDVGWAVQVLYCTVALCQANLQRCVPSLHSGVFCFAGRKCYLYSTRAHAGYDFRDRYCGWHHWAGEPSRQTHAHLVHT